MEGNGLIPVWGTNGRRKVTQENAGEHRRTQENTGEHRRTQGDAGHRSDKMRMQDAGQDAGEMQGRHSDSGTGREVIEGVS